MAKPNKTTETAASVGDYVKAIKDDKRRQDVDAIIKLITKHTGIKAKMWGTAIVGFGTYHYKYESGHEGSAPLAGLASRSNALVLYIAGEPEEREKNLAKLGKHKIGKACIYIQKLEDIDTKVLLKMVDGSISQLKKLYPEQKAKS